MNQQIIEKAMEDAQRTTKIAIDEHWYAFLSQMRDKVGVENIKLEEPYLKFELVKNTLQYLRQLDKFQMNLTANGTPKETDILSRLELEKSRHVIHVKQNMDAQRQQEFGINQYIWRSSNEACPICAPLDGQIFTYGEASAPGEIHPNCQCSAEPIPDGDGKPAEYPLEDKILEIAILLASITPWGRAAKIGTKVVRGLGKIGDKIINGTGGNKPPPKPPEKPPTDKPKPDITKRPEGIPKDWKGVPTKDGKGVVYQNPKDPGSYVKVQKGKPQSSNLGQRYDNVRIQKNGQSYDKNGNKVPQKSQESHIPIEDFKIDGDFFK